MAVNHRNLKSLQEPGACPEQEEHQALLSRPDHLGSKVASIR